MPDAVNYGTLQFTEFHYSTVIRGVGAPMRLSEESTYIGLAERLSGLFTGTMASRSVGELQEMEGEFSTLKCQNKAFIFFSLPGFTAMCVYFLCAP